MVAARRFPAAFLAKPRPFFGAAAEAMRRILIASARRKLTQRRSAGSAHINVDEVEIASPTPDDQLLALDEALESFSTLEPKQADLVKLRYFVGLTIEESAEVLGISQATTKCWWTYSRAWLYHRIKTMDAGSGSQASAIKPGKSRRH